MTNLWPSNKYRRKRLRESRDALLHRVQAQQAVLYNMDNMCHPGEIVARLQKVAPCIEAQIRTAACGLVAHSSRRLVNDTTHNFGVAAKHLFSRPISQYTEELIKLEQRGKRKSDGRLPPPPPPLPLPVLQGAIHCWKLEEFRRELYSGSSISGYGSNEVVLGDLVLEYLLGTDPVLNDDSKGNIVTDIIDNDNNGINPIDNAGNVTDPFVDCAYSGGGSCVGSAPLPERLGTVTDIIENDEADVTDLIHDRAVGFPDNIDNCNETKPKDKQEGAEGPLMFSEAFSHEAICLFLKTGSTEHILRKYKSLLNVTVHIDSVCHAPASKVFIYKMLYNSQRRVVVSILKSIQLPFSDVDSQVDLVDRLFQFMAGLTTGSKEWETLPIFMRPVAMGSTIACRRKCADAYASIRNFFKTDPCNHKMKKYTFRCKDAGECQ